MRSNISLLSSLQNLKTQEKWGWGLYSIALLLTLSIYRHFSTAFVCSVTVLPFLISAPLRQSLPKDFNETLKKPLFLLPLLYSLLMMVLSLWSANREISFKTGFTALLTVLVFALLQNLLHKVSNSTLKRTLTLTFVVGFVSLGLVLFQSLTHVSLRALLSHGATVIKTYSDLLIATLIPCCAYLWCTFKARGVCITILLILIINAYLSSYQTGFIALILSLIPAAFIYFFPKVMPKIYAWIMVFITLVHPLLLKLFLAPFNPVKLTVDSISRGSHLTSFYHRMVAWEFAVKKIDESPFFGHGANAGRFIEGGQAYLAKYTQYMPSHPHDFILQVWFESGLVGATLLAVFLYVLISALAPKKGQTVTPQDKSLSFWLTYYLFLCFFIFGISHSLWHKWVLMALCAGGLLLVEYKKRINLMQKDNV